MTSEWEAEAKATTAALWTIWVLGCVVAVLGCWFIAFVSGITLFGGEVTEEKASTVGGFIDAAAVISVASAILMAAVAVVRGRKYPLSASAVAALVLAVIAPWAPVVIAVGGQVSGG